MSDFFSTASMASSSSSLVPPSSLSPKSLILSKPTSKSLILSKPTTQSSPFSLFFNSISLKTTTTTTTNNSVASRFVLNASRKYEFQQKVASSGRTDVDYALFVGNISFRVDSNHLAGLFERAGDVETVELIHDKMTGKSRGFAFVTMSTVEEAKAAAQLFDGYALDGRAIKVNYGPPARRAIEVNYGPPPRKAEYGSRPLGGSYTGCYVSNLSWNVDDESLKTLFNEQGKVLKAQVVYDRESGKSKGYGFVTYGSSDEVENAISFLNGVELDGREIRVSVAQRRV